MNNRNTDCDKAEQLILLEHSSEISALESDELKVHVASCTKCRKYRGELHSLLSTAKGALPAGEPSRKVIQNILAEARRQQDQNTIAFPTFVRMIGAIAALLLITLGGWFFISHASHLQGGRTTGPAIAKTGNEPATTGDNLKHSHTSVEMASSVPLSTAEQKGTTRNERIKALAADLLEMEGLSVDESDLDIFNGHAAPDATDLQSGSNCAFPAGRSA